MPLRYREWLQRFQAGDPARAIFLCGPESWLRDQALARIKERLFQDAGDSRLGHERFHGGEGPLAQVSSALASVGLFTSTRLVTLSNPERASRAPLAERRELLGLLGRGLPGAFFVTYSERPFQELERRNEWTRALLGACQSVDLGHPNAGEAMRWLLEESSRRGVMLEAQAGAYLLSRIGPDLQDLSTELEKLSLWCEAGQRVGVDRVRELVRGGCLGDGFEFSRAALAGRLPDALRLFSAVHRTEATPLTLWRLQRLAREGLARRSSAGETLMRLLRQTYEVERDIKSGRIPSGMDAAAMEIGLAAAMPPAKGVTRGPRPRPPD